MEKVLQYLCIIGNVSPLVHFVDVIQSPLSSATASCECSHALWVEASKAFTSDSVLCINGQPASLECFGLSDIPKTVCNYFKISDIMPKHLVCEQPPDYNQNS